MSHPSVDRLKQEELLADYGFISNPRAVHHALERSIEVCDLRSALSSGEIGEESLRLFVVDLLQELLVGRLFPYDAADIRHHPG